MRPRPYRDDEDFDDEDDFPRRRARNPGRPPVALLVIAGGVGVLILFGVCAGVLVWVNKPRAADDADDSPARTAQHVPEDPPISAQQLLREYDRDAAAADRRFGGRDGALVWLYADTIEKGGLGLEVRGDLDDGRRVIVRFQKDEAANLEGVAGKKLTVRGRVVTADRRGLIMHDCRVIKVERG